MSSKTSIIEYHLNKLRFPTKCLGFFSNWVNFTWKVITLMFFNSKNFLSSLPYFFYSSSIIFRFFFSFSLFLLSNNFLYLPLHQIPVLHHNLVLHRILAPHLIYDFWEKKEINNKSVWVECYHLNVSISRCFFYFHFFVALIIEREKTKRKMLLNISIKIL